MPRGATKKTSKAKKAGRKVNHTPKAKAQRAAKLKPLSGASLRPEKSAAQRAREDKLRKWAEWEAQGGKRITVPAHDETLEDGRVIHHKEYYYVLPPKKDATGKAKSTKKSPTE